MSNIDFELFAKYSRPGPRYTSYPTALEFNESFNSNDFVNSLKAQDSNKPLSLYAHIPFCRSACYFCGCNVIYTSLEEKKERYIEYLKKELELLKECVDTKRKIVQFHFGGGTPTYLSPKQLEQTIKLIWDLFSNFDSEAEIGCEIDPRFFEEEHLKVLVAHGFNRLSFGVQDFNPKVQEAIHRIQSFDLTKNAIDLARNYGIKSINIDLIYGLPYQSLESFSKTLELILSLDPDRLAIFNYAHVPWLKKSMRKIDETTLPSPAEKLRILKYTFDFLTAKGYEPIGMDHFAKPDDELFLAISKKELHRNFQGYTTKGGADLLGIGVSSISEGDDFYAQNYKDLESYERALDEKRLPTHRGIKLNLDDKIRKSLIMELMSNFVLDIKEFEDRFQIDFMDYFRDELREWDEFINIGLIEIDNQKIKVSPTGRMLIRNIVMVFDIYTKRYSETQKRFSKTI